jgi:hypothetical protein
MNTYITGQILNKFSEKFSIQVNQEIKLENHTAKKVLKFYQ